MPSRTSMSLPSRLILAMSLQLLRRLPPNLARLAGNLRVGAGGGRKKLAAGLGLDELHHGLRRFHAVRVGVVVLAQVLVGEPRELVLVVVHVVEEVDGIGEGTAGLNRLVGAGFGAEA